MLSFYTEKSSNLMFKTAKALLSIYRPSHKGPVILFASPRGGSTWVSELIASQPEFWPISEPLNVRRPWVQAQLGISEFHELYGAAAAAEIAHYYQKLFSGGYAELKLRPGNRYYRPLTRRIVVKENQAGLDRIPWFEDTFGVGIIHLLRHPVAVALSREVFPLLEGFHKCALRERFSAEQLRCADAVVAEGSHLERGVVAWCLHHLPALRNHRESWLQLTYEETVLCPERVVEALADKMHLPDKAKMMAQINMPSQVLRKSDAETQALLKGGDARKRLVSKWLQKVSADEKQRVAELLNIFGVSLYSGHEALPRGMCD